MLIAHTILNYKITARAFITIILFAVSSLAQDLEPPEPSRCNHFDNAEKIFVGSFQKQKEKTGGENKKYLVSNFSIRRSIKGLKPNENKVSIPSGHYAGDLKIGETYIVFLRRDESKLTTYRLSAVFPLTILGNVFSDGKKQSRKKLPVEPKFAFTWLPGATNENPDDFKVTIKSDGISYKPKYNDDGIFTLAFPAGTKVSVSVEIPIESVLSAAGTRNWSYEIVAGHTVLNYILGESNGICNYNKFLFMPY